MENNTQSMKDLFPDMTDGEKQIYQCGRFDLARDLASCTSFPFPIKLILTSMETIERIKLYTLLIPKYFKNGGMVISVNTKEPNEESIQPKGSEI
jgi:hypothetical protein